MIKYQTNFFDALYPTFRFEKGKPIRVVELFVGIGFQAMGLDLAEIPYKVVATSEIDKFAIKAYEAIHGHNPNLGSITDIHGKDIPNDIDLLTYSFPCTDLSKAGKQKGLNNTSSGLVYEVLRILAELRDIDNLPKVLIMENVVDLVQSKFIKQFNEIQRELEGLGYTNFTQKLNAKNYGIAQNRERVFMVSILGKFNYTFPKAFALDNQLLNYLEDEVEESLYLSEEQMNKISIEIVNSSISKTVRSGGRGSTDHHSWDLVKCTKSIKVVEATSKGFDDAYLGDSVNLEQPNSKTRRGRVGRGIANTLTTSCNQGVVQADGYYTKQSKSFDRGPLKGLSRTIKAEQHDAGVVINKLWIRRLSNTETGRLMGMSDEQIERQRGVMSNSQMYKQHGNGIVAQVIGYIVGMMYYENESQLREVIQKNSHGWL